MKQNSVKKRLAKFTGNYTQVDKKILGMKKSWDEVDKLIQPSAKTKNGSDSKSTSTKSQTDSKSKTGSKTQNGTKKKNNNNLFNYQDLIKNKFGTMNKK